jgi:hypothetical protein
LVLSGSHTIGQIISKDHLILVTEFDAYLKCFLIKPSFYSTCVLELSPVFRLASVLFDGL